MAKAAKPKKQIEEDTNLPLLEFITLYDVSIDIHPTTDPLDSELNFDISITAPSKLEDKYSFRCRVAVGRKKPDAEDNFIEVGAEYGCLFADNKLSEENLLDVAKLYAATSAWTSFCSLFSVVSQQMKVEFPPLPTFPGSVRAQSDDDFSEKDVVTSDGE